MPSDVSAAPPVASAPPAARIQPVRRRVRFFQGKSGPVPPLLRTFWVVCALLALFVAYKIPQLSLNTIISVLLIIPAAMWPTYLWVSNKVRGLPLFPAFALTSLWHYAIPLLFRDPMIVMFPSAHHLTAAWSVTGFLLIGTAVWYPIARRPPRPPATCWMMNDLQVKPALFITLGLCLVWGVLFGAGFVPLPENLVSGARLALVVVETLVGFVISYHLGRGMLTPAERYTFYGLQTGLILISLPSLVLNVGMMLAVTPMMGYTIAAKRLPWRVGVAIILLFSFLQAGKGEMRERYMQQEDPTVFKLPQYPRVLSEWMVASADATKSNFTDDGTTDESLMRRDTLMQWLLYFEWFSPDQVPYLHGDTYAVIPRGFVPRVLDPKKPLSNEGSFILAIAYGIQTREETDFVTFGFGLLNEAYANFGYFGIGGLAAILGAFYGAVSHWSRRMPLLSFRALFAFLIASFAVQAESVSTYLVASLFQSSTVLLVLSALFMRRQRLNQVAVSRLD